MKLTVEISDKQLDNLSEGAKQELSSQLRQYAENIVKEANLIEEGNHELGAETEITSSIIMQAVRKYKNHYIPKQRSRKGMIVLKTVAAFSMLFTGLLFDANGYHNNTSKLIAFIIFLITACVSNLMKFEKEED